MTVVTNSARDNEVAILARILGDEGGRFPEDLARYILNAGFSDKDKARMHELEARLRALEVQMAHPDGMDLEQTLAEHAEAVRLGMNGVPTVHVEGDDAFVTGAYPIEMYRRWVTRRLAAAGA